MVSAKCLPVRPLLQALEHDRGVDAAKGKVIGDYEVGVDVALLTYDVGLRPRPRRRRLRCGQSSS